MSTLQDLRQRRRERLRFQLRQKAVGRPRLSVFRSGKNIYAQVIDDSHGRTLAAASSLDKTLRESLRTGADKAAAAGIVLHELTPCARSVWALWIPSSIIRSASSNLPWLIREYEYCQSRFRIASSNTVSEKFSDNISRALATFPS